MAPSVPPRKSVAKSAFPALFLTLKPQVYHDPLSRGPGSHTVRTIAWNPTGSLIATGSADRTLRIWNPDQPQVRNSTDLRGHAGGIERIAWNPTKEAELASVSSDGTCRFWDVMAKSCISVVQLGGDGLTVCWSPDGQNVIVGRKDDVLIPIVMHPTPTAQSPQPQSVQTNQIIFAHSRPPAPQYLFLTRGDGSVLIVSYPSFQEIHTLNAHTSSCLAVALAPNGRYLAIGGSDALISLYDTSDWICQRTITSYTGAVKSVAFSFDGSYVVGGCDEGTNGLEVVHAETGEGVGKVDLAVGTSAGHSIGSGGIGGGMSGGMGGYAASTSSSLTSLISLGTGGGQVAWHPNRYWIAYAGDGGGLRILGAAGGSM